MLAAVLKCLHLLYLNHCSKFSNVVNLTERMQLSSAVKFSKNICLTD